MLKLLPDAVAAIGTVVLIAAALALVTQWAWIGVVVPTFGLPAVTLLQAFQLNLLAGLLVKSTLTTKSR